MNAPIKENVLMAFVFVIKAMEDLIAVKQLALTIAHITELVIKLLINAIVTQAL